jgi:hypothetical protein
MATTMNKVILTLRALASAFLLGLGLSTYAGQLDPMSQHLGQTRSTVPGEFNPADSCTLPCVMPH